MPVWRRFFNRPVQNLIESIDGAAKMRNRYGTSHHQRHIKRVEKFWPLRPPHALFDVIIQSSQPVH